MDETFSAVRPGGVARICQNRNPAAARRTQQDHVFVTHDHATRRSSSGDKVVAVSAAAGRCCSRQNPQFMCCRTGQTELVSGLVGRRLGYRGCSFCMRKGPVAHEVRQYAEGELPTQGRCGPGMNGPCHRRRRQKFGGSMPRASMPTARAVRRTTAPSEAARLPAGRHALRLALNAARLHRGAGGGGRRRRTTARRRLRADECAGDAHAKAAARSGSGGNRCGTYSPTSDDPCGRLTLITALSLIPIVLGLLIAVPLVHW